MSTSAAQRDRPDASLLERCRRIPTATWSDALDRLDIAGVMDGLVIRSGRSRVAGPAMTVREQVGPLGSHALETFDVGKIITATGRGRVCVVDMDGTEVSTFGGLSARAAVKTGMAGIVIDGGCRDLEAIRASGLFVASRHVTPRSGKRRVDVVDVGGTVTCAGVSVAAGDCVIADETGIVVVPRDRLEEALNVAELISGTDRIFEAELDRGIEFGAVAAKLRHL